jgi:hypothetical protein
MPDDKGPTDSYLADLVDQKLETPEIEYKGWMDLSEPTAKAKIAKHLCALCNYGGGYLVFGISDDGSHDEPHPSELDGYKQDVINQIVAKYLQPAFHCAVYTVHSRATGKPYPVVRVPPHGQQPVCAKKNGPDADGRPVGVRAGVHYIRIAGPQSVAIDKPELWRDVLHRCVTNERQSLLASIGQLFERPSEISTSTPEISRWLDDALVKWNGLQPQSGWPVDPRLHRRAFAFRLLAANGVSPTAISLSLLRKQAREASNAAAAELGYTAAPFELIEGSPFGPKVALVDDIEALEAIYLIEGGNYVLFPSVWRLSVQGAGAEIGTCEEDSSWVRDGVEQNSSRLWPAGKKLSPRLQAVRTYQFISFVRHFASAFPDATHCQFMIDYGGLDGRNVEDAMRGTYYSKSYTSAVPQRRAQIDTSLAALAGDGADEAVAKLIDPIFRLFDGWSVHPDFVRAERASH